MANSDVQPVRIRKYALRPAELKSDWVGYRALQRNASASSSTVIGLPYNSCGFKCLWAVAFDQAYHANLQ